MQKTSTPELLVKHLYNETNVSESELVQIYLKNDNLLQEEYSQMQAVKYALDESGGNEPRKSVIADILNYAKKSSTEMA